MHRLIGPARGQLTVNNLWRALTLAFNLVIRVGLISDYRRPFWRAARHALRHGQIDAALGIGFAAHHLIQFSREALSGKQNASFYSANTRERAAAPDREAVQSLRKTA